jgi:predicted DNA-binding transcriptional regulator AlpA
MEKTVKGKLISISEAAEKSGMSDKWLYARMRTGTLPFPWFMPSPGKRLIDSADLEDWLRSIKIMPGY